MLTIVVYFLFEFFSEKGRYLLILTVVRNYQKSEKKLERSLVPSCLGYGLVGWVTEI